MDGYNNINDNGRELMFVQIQPSTTPNMPFHRHSRPKLTKTRSNDNTPVLANTDAYVAANHSRTSFSDLKSNARSTLPRQSTFPEDVGTAADMPHIGKQRLSRVVSSSALDVDAGFGASSATVNSLESKRATNGTNGDTQRSPGLPGLPESLSKIDIEQAINLLQQLKKTASPEELVSLHKALLPTRDVSPVPPPQLSSIEEHAAFSALSGRTSSARPAGLATRGSFLEDPLRSQDEVAAKTTKGKDSSAEQHGAWFQETMSAVHARTFSITSTGTAPDSSYSRQGGAFSPGTLRVTNGRPASPEPATTLKLVASEDKSSPKEEIPPARRSEDAPVLVSGDASQATSQQRQRRHSQDSLGSGALLSLAQRRSQQWGLRTSRPIPSLTSVVQPKPQGPRPETLKPEQRQKSETKDDALPARRSTDMPRFEQRWNQRAKHLSNEYLLDCDIVTSPYVEQVHELPSHRLSTVKDLDEDEEEDDDACAKALLKLTSRPPALEQIQDGNEGGENSEEASAPNKAPFLRNSPPALRKQDSGYYSEASNSTPKRTSPTGASRATTLETTPEKSPVPAIDISTAAPVIPASSAANAEAKSAADPRSSSTSLHSPRSATAQKDAPPVESKRKLSPLAIFRSRARDAKKNRVAANTSSVASQPYESLPQSPSAQSSHTGKTSIETRRRTLQKKLPEPVRQQRKEEQDRARQSMDVSQATVGTPVTDSPTRMPEQQSTPATPTSAQTIIKHVPPAKHNSDADDEGSVSSSPHPSQSSHRSSRSWGGRGKSFGRRSSKTIPEESVEQPPVPPLPSSLERKRSKSLAGPGKALSKRPGNLENMANASCIRSHNETTADPVHSDFQSAARALETIPQKESEGSTIASVPRGVRRASLRGKKSRENMTKPAKAEAATPAQRVAPIPAKRSVQDLYPEWQSKPASEESSPAAQEAQIAAAQPQISLRGFPSHSIPPLPELPTDLESILCKADLMMSKKMKNSPKASPTAQSRSSAESGRDQSSTNLAPQDQDLSLSLFSQTVVGEPPIAEGPSDNEMPAEADSKPLHRRQFSFEPLIKPPRAAETKSKPASPTHDAQHSGWPGWEHQSARWHQRLSVIGGAAELPAADEMSPVDNTTPTANSPTSPSIVVSSHVTPPASEEAADSISTAHKRRSTVQVVGHMPHDSDVENESAVPSLRRSNSIVSTATYVTMSSTDGRASRIVDLSRNSAISHTTTTTMTTTVSSHTSLYTSNNGSTSSVATGRNRSASQVSLTNYMPYRPADSVQAERSRALNMARRSCQVMKSDVDKMRLGRQPSRSKPTSPSGFNRYGGGLEFGWDRQAGLVGSAGTRSSSSDNLSRKSIKISEDYGLDLTDVPVFLQRRT